MGCVTWHPLKASSEWWWLAVEVGGNEGEGEEAPLNNVEEEGELRGA